MPPAKKPAFTAKDYISIALSILAITFSLLTYYYSNLYVNDDIVARIADSPGIITTNKNKINDASLKLILINQGNKPGVVLEVGYALGREKGDFEFGDVVRSDSIPFILQPNQIRFVNIHLPGQYLVDNFSSGDTASTRAWRTPAVMGSTFFLKINFSSLDSKGNRVNILSKSVAKIIIDKKDGVISTGPIGDAAHKGSVTIRLFKDTN